MTTTTPEPRRYDDEEIEEIIAMWPVRPSSNGDLWNVARQLRRDLAAARNEVERLKTPYFIHNTETGETMMMREPPAVGTDSKFEASED